MATSHMIASILKRSSAKMETEYLSAEQIKEYSGVLEMFDEQGNGKEKLGEWEQLESLLGINFTKSKLGCLGKDMDGDNKGFFNGDGFLVLMGIYYGKSHKQKGELTARIS
ncbi:calmodulin-like protein 6 [Phodopus roborovskii]|uniref:calmodulin-like protein 6 n=1 Tax=Phodopus roborovskii TaxID=109678 RepID=UPI0021E38434|nr:calmodulin-like protein 6 [Phodopus roborovskii]